MYSSEIEFHLERQAWVLAALEGEARALLQVTDVAVEAGFAEAERRLAATARHRDRIIELLNTERLYIQVGLAAQVWALLDRLEESEVELSLARALGPDDVRAQDALHRARVGVRSYGRVFARAISAFVDEQRNGSPGRGDRPPSREDS